MFLKNTYKCNKIPTIKNYVDCVYWSKNTANCNSICSLNVINNPSEMDCAKCTKRKSPGVDKIPEKKDFYSEEQVENKAEPSFQEKTKNYIKAESSQMFAGKVSDEIFEKRKAICLTCDLRVQEAKNQKDEIGWCKGGCGCVVGNPRAALSQKLYMPTLSCPKGKFGPEKGSGFKVEDAIDSAKGIITSVKNLFEKDK